jgi:hypothetical protein
MASTGPGRGSTRRKKKKREQGSVPVVHIIINKFSKISKFELLNSRRVGIRYSPRESQRDVVAAPCALARAYHILFVLTNMRLSYPYIIRHEPKTD